jgi:hypothetical protein
VPAFFHHKPSDGKMGVITLIALGILAVFGLWIQALEAAVLPSGFNVLHVEFAITPEQMDRIISAWLSMNVLHVEVLIDQLDVFMMPGWSIMFFCAQVLGLRALRFLDVGEKFRYVSWKVIAFPLIAGAVDTVENIIIFHVLSNPSTYIRAIVPLLFVFVLAKWAMLFTGIVIGTFTNIWALAIVVKRSIRVTPLVRV